MNTEKKLAISFFALCQATAIVMDKLKGTKIYKQALKNRCNTLMKECEKEIDNLYEKGKLDSQTEEYFHKTTSMVETMVDVIENKDLDIFINLLKDYRNGEIMILPDNKHQKIASQLERV